MPADVAVFSGSRSGPQFVRRNPRQKNTLLNSVPFDVNSLAAFKTAPCRKPADFESRRPYVGNCCQCMPISKGDLQDGPYEELGIRNILDAKQQLKLENVWCTFFSKIVYTWRRPLFGPYPDLSMAVLTNRRVVEAVQKAARELDTEQTTDKIAVVEKRAAKIMKKMKSSISTVFIKFTGWFLLKFLSIMHRGVLVHRGQMAVVKRAAEKGMPMIYLPLHRSHLDYILMTFILWNYDIRPPHVAAGDNMDIPFFSQLMRSLGGFFIRRRLDNGGVQKDHVYRAILTTYMLELLKKGESLEFFIEGGRSRTGRAVIPKGGLMSVVTEACREGIIYDAYIVPVTFSYDRLLEGTFNQEQMGLPKMKETFFRACKAIFSVLLGDYGFVRINFAQPFSLREFLQSAERFPPDGLHRSTSLSNASASGLNLSQQALSLKPANGSPDGLDTSRAVVTALAQHTVYTSVHTQTPMSTHCLAFLFLTKFRQGGTVAALAEGLEWLRQELRARKVDVGFCGSADNAVLYAQKLLGDEVVMQSVTDAGVVLTPSMEMPAVFTLSYNANALTAAFVMESIAVCAVLVESELLPSLWCEDQQVPVLPTIIRDSLVTTATTLCNILQAEFVLVPPCKQLEDVLLEKVDDMLEREILLPLNIQYDEDVTIQDQYSTSQLSRKFNWNDDDEELEGRYIDYLPLQVNVNRADIRAKLRFLHSVLAPVLESYLLTALFINHAITEHWLDMPEGDFMKKLGDFATERAKNKLVMYMESCGRVVLKNAVKTFQQLGVLDSYQGANLTMLTPADDDTLTDRLHNYIHILSVARS